MVETSLAGFSFVCPHFPPNLAWIALHEQTEGWSWAGLAPLKFGHERNHLVLLDTEFCLIPRPIIPMPHTPGQRRLEFAIASGPAKV